MKNYQNKNIWILNHYAITPDITGSTRHYDFALELIKKGYKISIFASGFQHQGERKEIKLEKKESWRIENIDGINFVWIKTFPYQKNDWRRTVNMFSYLWRVYCLGRKITKINKNIKKPDIIIGSSPHLLSPLCAYWLSKIYKAKFIIEIRDLWPQTFIDIGKIKKNNPIIIILKLLEKFLYKKSNKIITLLPYSYKYIEKLGISRKKIVYIPNGVNYKYYQNIKEYTGILNNPIQIIYIGGITRTHSLNIILKNAKKLQKKYNKKLKFIFIGEGDEKKDLIRLSQNYKLKNVKFHKGVPKYRIPQIMEKADALILSLIDSPLYKYGISLNKLFEYFASGRPVIFSTGIHKNFVDNIKAGIVVSPKNPYNLTGGIIKFINLDSEERKKMGGNGKKYVKKYHDIPILVNKLVKIIEEIN